MKIDSITTLPSHILNCIYESILVVDQNNRLKYYNQSFENLLLLSSDNISTIKDRILGDILPAKMSAIPVMAQQCISRVEVVQGILEIQIPPLIQYYKVVAIPNLIEKDRVEAIIILNNTTDYELKKKELHQQLDFLSKLEKRMPLGVFMFDYEDDDPIVTLWNPMMVEYFGVQEKDILGNSIQCSFNKDTVSRLSAAIEAIKSTGLYYDSPSEEIETPQGVRSFHIVITPIKDMKLTSNSYLCIMEDITIRIRQEKELQYMHEMLKEALSQISEQLEQTDAEFSSILESSINVCIFSLDRDLNYRFFNPYHEKYMMSQFGIAAEKGEKAKCVKKSSSEKGLPILEYIEQALGGESQALQVHFQNKEGQINYLNTVFSPLYDNGIITGVTVLLFDTTAQKHTAEKAEIFQFVADHAEYGVILVNKDFSVNYINPFGETQFGLPSDEIIGNKVDLLFSERHRENILKSLDKTLKGTVQNELQVDLTDQSDETVNIMLNFVPYGDLEHQAGGIAITCLDVSTLEQAKNTLIQAKDRAEEASIQKSTFVANMSHEFRTPLNAILGFSSLLKGEIHDTVLKSHVDSIISSGTVLKKLVNEVLDFSKIEAGKMEIQITKVNVYEFFKEIFRIFQLQFHNKSIDFEIFSKEPVPEFLYFDQLRLQQVLINLINNGLKFTQYGCVKVIFKYIDNKKILLLNVEDSGIGIAGDDQSRVFESFEQREKENTRVYEGTGLGLTITEKLLSLMKGSIRLKSDIGAGCSFALKIPMAVEENTESLSIHLHEPLTVNKVISCYVERPLITPTMMKFGKRKGIRFLPFDGIHEFQAAEYMKILTGNSEISFVDESKVIRIYREYSNDFKPSDYEFYCLSQAMPEIKRLHFIYSILIYEDGRVKKKQINFSNIDQTEFEMLKKAVDLKIFSDIEESLPIIYKCEDENHYYSEQIEEAILVFDIPKLENIMNKMATMF